jgi:4-diphosphocytidyl-2-C-methyl-D-erythritol kinase
VNQGERDDDAAADGPPALPLLHARAFAKINLALAVGPPIPRGMVGAGMHPVASWMHCIALWDNLAVRSLGSTGLEGAAAATELIIRWAPDAPRPSPIDWSAPSDLAVRACGVLEAHTAVKLAASISLTKRIPVGGGLGGGSSDAAAAMMALNDLYDLGVTIGEMARLSAAIGSDVAFFLDDAEAMPRPALVTGLGEGVERLPRSDGSLVLVIPPFGCSTSAVYRAHDELAPAALRPARETEVRHLAGEGLAAGGTSGLFNDLAAAAEAVEPRLADLRRHCRGLADREVHITGSGSTMFIIADDPEHASALAARICHQSPGVAAMATALV